MGDETIVIVTPPTPEPEPTPEPAPEPEQTSEPILLGQLLERVNTISSTLETIATTQTEQTARLEGFSSELTTLHSRINDLETELDEPESDEPESDEVTELPVPPEAQPTSEPEPAPKRARTGLLKLLLG